MSFRTGGGDRSCPDTELTVHNQLRIMISQLYKGPTMNTLEAAQLNGEQLHTPRQMALLIDP